MRTDITSAEAVEMISPVTVEPSRTLVLIVDMENEFCDPAGSHYLGGDVASAVESTCAVLAGARAAGCDVVWIRSVRDLASPEFTTYGRAPYLLENTWATEFTAPLAPALGETVLEKRCHDCFTATKLDQWLAEHGATGPQWHVLIAGVALSTCVNHAVLGCSARNLRTALLLDCTAPRATSASLATLRNYGRTAYNYNVTVTTGDDVTFAASQGR